MCCCGAAPPWVATLMMRVACVSRAKAGVAVSTNAAARIAKSPRVMALLSPQIDAARHAVTNHDDLSAIRMTRASGNIGSITQSAKG